MTETYYEALRQDGGEVVALIEEIGALSLAAREAAWDAARDAALDAAWDAAWHAARDAARDAALDAALDAARDAALEATWDDAWEAVLATAVRDVISPEHYATLMAPMEAARAVMLREHPQ